VFRWLKTREILFLSKEKKREKEVRLFVPGNKFCFDFSSFGFCLRNSD
jgi:hypothetical protein